MTSQSEDLERLMGTVKHQCDTRGINSIKGFAALFRGIDRDFSKNITFYEFKVGLTRFGVDLTDKELSSVFNVFDKDGSGMVDFREFLTTLLPKMSPCRVALINKVFDYLDTIKDDVLDINDMKCMF